MRQCPTVCQFGSTFRVVGVMRFNAAESLDEVAAIYENYRCLPAFIQ